MKNTMFLVMFVLLIVMQLVSVSQSSGLSVTRECEEFSIAGDSSSSSKVICAFGYHSHHDAAYDNMDGRTYSLFKYMSGHDTSAYTGLSAMVEFNDAHTDCSVKINDKTACSACSICPCDGSCGSGLLQSGRISADCTNVPHGRHVTCEPLAPVYFPFDLSVGGSTTLETTTITATVVEDDNSEKNHTNKWDKMVILLNPVMIAISLSLLVVHLIWMF